MNQLSFRLWKSCCCCLWLTALLAVGCGVKGEKKSRLAQSQADFFVQQGESLAPVLGGRDLASNPNIALGRPYGADTNEIMISRNQYVLSWSKTTRTPNWVAWRLRRDDLGQARRTNAFSVDPDLEDYLGSSDGSRAVTQQDYRGSCLDRGHLAPSADRTATVSDNKVTFYMSNMMPQTAYNNRGNWMHLEEHARSLVRGTDNTVYIIAGSIFASSPSHIGPQQDIAVPERNFKLIVDGAAHAKPTVLAAVIMPNTTSAGTDPVLDRDQACQDSNTSLDFVDQEYAIATRQPNNDWEQFLTSVEAIEQAAGLDLSFLH